MFNHKATEKRSSHSLFLKGPPLDFAGAGAGEGIGEIDQARDFFRVWRDSKVNQYLDVKVNS